MNPRGTSFDTEPVDVTFLLEGTYPFVSGGVSSWVHEIIQGLPGVRFAIVFLGSTPEQYGPMRYQLPRNVVHMTTHYLMSRDDLPPPRARAGQAQAVAKCDALYAALRDPHQPLPLSVLDPVLLLLGRPGHGITAADFLHSRAAWRRICDAYAQLTPQPSFVDYFWAVRSTHTPLFALARVAERLPPTRAVHAVSTGYAGFLGALLARRRGCPFVLTEHGIYTKERRIDLAQASWIKDLTELAPAADETSVGLLRSLWIGLFEGLGRIAYAVADPIVSLYEGNRARQIADGADATRTRVIANGIDVDRFARTLPQAPAQQTGTNPPVIGLLGRVVPIKDVGTFVRAMRIVCSRHPTVLGWIAGPLQEDPAYATECRELIASLGLSDRVELLGFQATEDLLPRLSVLTLTSISEALPLVVLEAFAAGVPVVATDVGACRALIEGESTEDRALGAAGVVTPIANPDATARALLGLLTDPNAWRAAQHAGRERVVRSYTRDRMLGAYHYIYQQALRDEAGAGEVDSGGDRLRAS